MLEDVGVRVTLGLNDSFPLRGGQLSHQLWGLGPRLFGLTPPLSLPFIVMFFYFSKNIIFKGVYQDFLPAPLEQSPSLAKL